MNDIPNSHQVEAIKTRYPPGSRVLVASVEDPYTTIPSGTQGTVIAVDDIGTVHCSFDNGQSLGLIAGVDVFSKVEPAREMQQSHKRNRSHER